ncbi:hypothetical protein [Bartonella refiksaydamii]|uniref:hypothetical protein n=1 Tax=Bartonella refiksaydamii TaxID=2654951 RepID=UPI0018DC59AD|nr:hypothetical protein [Bartonella refiksaydamii]
MLGFATKNEMMTKRKNKNNNNLIKKRIMGSQCTAVMNETKIATYTLLLYKKFIKLSICLSDLYR